MRVHPTVTLGGSLDTQVGFKDFDCIEQEIEYIAVVEESVDAQPLVEEFVEKYHECDVL